MKKTPTNAALKHVFSQKMNLAMQDAKIRLHIKLLEQMTKTSNN